MNAPLQPVPLTERPEWKALLAYYQVVRRLYLRQLFTNDPQRGTRFKAEACELYIDYSKNRITAETIPLHLQLAEACRLREHIEAMLPGQKINVTEPRATLLAFGKTEQQVRTEGTPDWLVPHRMFEGNRRTNTLLAERLTPKPLGTIVALYEHSVFTQGVIWDIDSLDRWGVELSKALAEKTIPELEAYTASTFQHDSSTNALTERYRRFKSIEPLAGPQGSDRR